MRAGYFLLFGFLCGVIGWLLAMRLYYSAHQTFRKEWSGRIAALCYAHRVTKRDLVRFMEGPYDREALFLLARKIRDNRLDTNWGTEKEVVDKSIGG